MFPHATCMCVRAAQKSNHNEQHRVLENPHNRHQCHNSDRSPNQKQSQENSWIIHRHVDFIKISVLSSAQVTSILQQSQHHLCNRQVSHVQIVSIGCVFVSVPKESHPNTIESLIQCQLGAKSVL